MANFGPWVDALIDIDGTNGDQLSDEVDLLGEYEFLVARIPTITSSTIGVNVAEKTAGTFIAMYILDDDATGSFLHATTAATTTNVVIFRIGGAQFLKMSAGSAQSADVTIPVRGFNR